MAWENTGEADGLTETVDMLKPHMMSLQTGVKLLRRQASAPS